MSEGDSLPFLLAELNCVIFPLALEIGWISAESLGKSLLCDLFCGFNFDALLLAGIEAHGEANMLLIGRCRVLLVHFSL